MRVLMNGTRHGQTCQLTIFHSLYPFTVLKVPASDRANPTGMDATCGTAEYMSPEMLRGELYSSLVDLWALGIIVFAMLSGELPFKDQNRTQLHKNILNGVYSLQSEVKGHPHIRYMFTLINNAHQGHMHCYHASARVSYGETLNLMCIDTCVLTHVAIQLQL